MCVTQWSEKLFELTKKYNPENIFNADETGPYYQCLPDKTLTFKGDLCHVGKNSNFKVLYRKEVVRQFLCDTDDKNLTTIYMLDAIWMASKAWNNVTEKTIENCFKKCNQSSSVEEDCVAVDTPPSGDEAPERWSEVTKKLNIEEFTFEEFVNFDDDLAICGELSDADIIASVSKDTDEDAGEDNVDCEVDAPDPDPTLRDARCAVITLRRFLQKKKL
ncbi:hypothetical protein WA026_002687 [Henosepilachna vigintioctopunctata]|uniref:DDE-1 domain-containing protein n=1 Tax=Henosepilachna vigintioctopunctata TaxID=420089 RepID=A0AAW1U227_9CUCU